MQHILQQNVAKQQTLTLSHCFEPKCNRFVTSRGVMIEK